METATIALSVYAVFITVIAIYKTLIIRQTNSSLKRTALELLEIMTISRKDIAGVVSGKIPESYREKTVKDLVNKHLPYVARDTGVEK